jgi:GT2 family glycosyltransferase
MTRRDLFEGFFLYWEDAELLPRIARAGFRRMYVPIASVRHLVGRSASIHWPGRFARFITARFACNRSHRVDLRYQRRAGQAQEA